MMELWFFGALAVIVVIAEYFNGKQRAETDNKIDEMHKWLMRCHPYKFNGYDGTKEIEFRNNNTNTKRDNETD